MAFMTAIYSNVNRVRDMKRGRGYKSVIIGEGTGRSRRPFRRSPCTFAVSLISTSALRLSLLSSWSLERIAYHSEVLVVGHQRCS